MNRLLNHLSSLKSSLVRKPSKTLPEYQYLCKSHPKTSFLADVRNFRFLKASPHCIPSTELRLRYFELGSSVLYKCTYIVIWHNIAPDTKSFLADNLSIIYPLLL